MCGGLMDWGLMGRSSSCEIWNRKMSVVKSVRCTFLRHLLTRTGLQNLWRAHCSRFSPPAGAMPCSDGTEAAAVSPAKRSRVEGAVLRFAKLSENATTPTRGSNRAAGFDLYSAYDYSIGPMDKAIVKTDIQIAVPPGCYGRVAPRSGLAAKHFIDVGAGVVDEDYRGNVGVVLFNFSKETFEVKKGDRVAQLVCERIIYPDLEELQTLDETERGSGGFGSTGRN